MTKVKIKITISNHASWKNNLEVEGEYEIVKEELDKFYEMAEKCMKQTIRDDAIHERAFETWGKTQDLDERINWRLC